MIRHYTQYRDPLSFPAQFLQHLTLCEHGFAQGSTDSQTLIETSKTKNFCDAKCGAVHDK